MPKIPTMEEMLTAGVHFGHQAAHWHPHMEPYIYTTRNGVHIIDLKKTQTKLETALGFITQVVANGGDILFVGSKVQAQPLVEAAAKEAGMPYVKARWIGGTLTNFNAIKRSTERYVSLLRGRDGGDWQKYTKKERVELQKDVDRLHGMVSGLVTMKQLPKAMFVVDIRTEQTAVKEANVVNVPVVALCDTNVNPKNVAHVIPSNDDATRGISLMLSCVVDAVKEGMKHRKVVVAAPAPVAKAPVRRAPAPAAAAPKAAVKAEVKAETKEEKPAAKKPAAKRTTKKAKTE